MYKQTQKTEKRKMTSILSFFLFIYEKTQKRENKNRAPSYLCSFFVRTNTKNGKTTNDFLFIVFPLMYENAQIFIFQISFFRFLWLFKWTKSWDREGVEEGGGGGGGLVGVGCSFRKLVYVLLVSTFYNRGMRLFSRVLQKWRGWKT